MILAQRTCEVPPEKREALLGFVASEMKGIYLAKGCTRHELYVPTPSAKKYFAFHVERKPTEIVEQLRFADVKAFEGFLAAMEQDPTAKAATGRYERDFGVFNCSFAIAPKNAESSRREKEMNHPCGKSPPCCAKRASRTSRASIASRARASRSIASGATTWTGS